MEDLTKFAETYLIENQNCFFYREMISGIMNTQMKRLEKVLIAKQRLCNDIVLVVLNDQRPELGV